MPRKFRPGVVFQPATYRGMQGGIDKLARAIRPTLGPRPRVVAMDKVEYYETMPRLLDDGATIARLIRRLPDRDEDVGAMYLRDVLWRLQNEVGDGTATAAVLFQSVYNQGVHYLTSGGNARRLHTCLERGLRAVLDELTRMTVSLDGREQLSRVAETVCYDPPLAELLGEVFEVVGEFGRVEIRAGRSRELEREYVEGMYWERGVLSRDMIADWEHVRTDLEEPAILISDLDVKDPRQLLPPIAMAIQAKYRSLLIMVGSMSESAIGLLLANKHPEKLRVVAVRTPGHGKEQQAWVLQDLAVLTGGRAFAQVAGDTFSQMRPEDFGHARRGWADLNTFGIIGGKGNPRQLRQHIVTLRNAYEQTDDPHTRDLLRQRIGKLLGGSATLWIGGNTELEINARKERAERAAAALRGAMLYGVLPGGGVALLNCRPALQRLLAEASDPDERAAYRILMRALAEPLRTIVSNAGFDASDVMAQLKLAGPGYGFDVRREQVVDMLQAGIYDAAVVQKSVVYTAVASAAQALTVDVLVHRREPERASMPDPRTPKQL